MQRQLEDRATRDERLAELLADCERLRRQLLRYGTHTSDCESRTPRGVVGGPCDCGWSELRAALAGVSEAPSD
jgi:hypothetical protein